jgi:hypothetical protein
MLPSNNITLNIESMKLLYLQELGQENIIQKFLMVIAEHVAKRGTNLQIVGKKHRIKMKDRLIGRVKTLLRLCI